MIYNMPEARIRKGQSRKSYANRKANRMRNQDFFIRKKCCTLWNQLRCYSTINGMDSSSVKIQYVVHPQTSVCTATNLEMISKINYLKTISKKKKEEERQQNCDLSCTCTRPHQIEINEMNRRFQLQLLFLFHNGKTMFHQSSDLRMCLRGESLEFHRCIFSHFHRTFDDYTSLFILYENWRLYEYDLNEYFQFLNQSSPTNCIVLC